MYVYVYACVYVYVYACVYVNVYVYACVYVYVYACVYVLRMDDHRLPKQCLYGEIQYDKGSAGGQKKRCKDAIGSHLDNVGIKRNEWETLAAMHMYVHMYMNICIYL